MIVYIERNMLDLSFYAAEVLSEIRVRCWACDNEYMFNQIISYEKSILYGNCIYYVFSRVIYAYVYVIWLGMSVCLLTVL